MLKTFYYTIEGYIADKDYSRLAKEQKALSTKHGISVRDEWHPDWCEILAIPIIDSKKNATALWKDLIAIMPHSDLIFTEHMKPIPHRLPNESDREFVLTMKPRVIDEQKRP